MGFVSGKWLVICIVFLLLFLAACEDATIKKTVPFNDTLSSDANVNSCECASGETCENGKCICAGKTCQGKCIPANACCTSAECDGKCINGKCISTICPLGEEFYDGECICSAGKFRCAEQGKCIDQKSCCHSGQCYRDFRCVPTVWKVSVCAKIDGRKICRTLSDNNRTEQIITETYFSLKPTAWWNNGNITLLVNNETFQLAQNQTRMFKSVEFHQEGIEIIGGSCKEED